jgi:hypothetical protein
MLKRTAIFTLICLAMSLWSPRATLLGPSGDGGGHIAGFAGHAAVLVANTGIRVQARTPHQPTNALSAGVVLVRAVLPPVWTAAHSVHVLPSYRVATHLSL